jgi:hypothetical protein
MLLKVLIYTIRQHDPCRTRWITIITNSLTDATPGNDSFVWYYHAPPVIDGNPSSDKLHAFNLTMFRRCIFIDLDVMLLRDISHLFRTSGFVAAYHPYDIVQQMCGIPYHQRMVGALFAFSPNSVDATALRRLTQTLAVNRDYHMRHFSEQSTLSCYFHPRMTLPRHFLYDISAMTWSVKSCHRWGGYTLRAACVSFNKSAGFQASDRCSNLSAHCVNMRADQARPETHIYAVHFKGKNKPWRMRTNNHSDLWKAIARRVSSG